MPVDPMPIAITSMRIVQCRYVEHLLLDDPVVRDYNSCNRCKEDRVATHEREEGRCGGENLPRDDDPASDDGSNDAASIDVDPLREENCEIIRSRDTVCL